jgi:exodeoxyribonuclease-5
LVKFIIAALNLDPESVAYISFTGKAAQVLRQKGNPNATTAHKLLYFSKRMKDGRYAFIPRKSIDNYKLIVVDEVSMLPKKMWDLLLSHHKYVIALGDPEQLPPIDKTQDNHVLDTPHVFLDEVMRQAKGSEIVRLSMWIRENKPVSMFPFAGEEVQYFKAKDLSMGMLLWADQILCATNKTRNLLNSTVREALGYGPLPDEKDKLICLHNHWDYESASGEWALTNGVIGRIENYNIVTERSPTFRNLDSKNVDIMYTDILLEDGDRFVNCPIDYNCLLTGQPAFTPKELYILNKNKPKDEDMPCFTPPYEFAYGYSMTTWKAQGSQWNKVTVLEEGFPYDKDEHRRWLYTSCTRASKRLTLIGQ